MVGLVEGRWVPHDYKEVKDEYSDGVCYVRDAGSKFFAMGYSGKRKNYDFYFQYNTREDRDKKVSIFFKNLRQFAEAKKQRAKERIKWRDEFLAKLVPGTLLSCSWGYEQTNVDFYKVLEKKGATVTLVKIGAIEVEATGPSSSLIKADPDRHLSDPFKKIVRSSRIQINGSVYLSHITSLDETHHRSWGY